MKSSPDDIEQYFKLHLDDQIDLRYNNDLPKVATYYTYLEWFVKEA